VAQYLEPFVTVIGITRKDVWQGALDANNNLRLISNQTALVDIKEAQAHAECLAQTLVESASTSEKARNIFLPNISLPLIPVNGTEFQHLVSNVLSDLTLTGVSSIHAEPGVGKSVAVTLAILGWAKGNPKSITVLIRGNLQLLEDFFRVSKEAYVPAVAENLFRILSDEGVRLQLVLDNVFDKKLGERGEMLMSLARAAFKYGQVVVVTQSREVAEEIGLLNGARTRVSPHQKCNASDYRWNEMQASTLLLNLNATAKLNRSMKESEDIVQRALTESFKKFKQDGAWVQENLEGARMPDGGWKPVDIEQFLISGIKPVLVPAVAGTTSPTQTKAVWVRQLQKDGKSGFEFDGNGFQVKDKDIQNIDDLKKAIKKEKPNKVQCDADEIDIYIQQQDGSWIKEEKMSESLRDTSESDCYGFTIP